MTFLVAVPPAIKVFNWTISLHKGQIHFDAPMLYALGFVPLFTTGGATGLIIATLAVERTHAGHVFHRRAFPLHHGRRHGQRFLRWASFLVTENHRPALPGDLGALYRDPHLCRLQPDLYAAVHSRLSRDAATVLRLSAGVAIVEPAVVGRRLDPRGRLCPAAVLSRLEHFLFGRRADENPYRATGLEWTTSSPPPKHNFERTPVVTTAPY